jgi:hypothetical protein
MFQKVSYVLASLVGLSTQKARSHLRDTDVEKDHILKELEEPYSEKLTVHMIHHTHDDVGWLKTVDEYWSGTDVDVKRVGVNLILTEVIPELMKDKEKRFSYVEMKFFSMWWERQDEAMKEDVRMLVREGRLELLNAGWSMQDEACAYYEDMINNMMLGHQFVLKEFGVKPRIGW